MYGKWVTVNLGEDIECKVCVPCVPDTPIDVLERQAINILRSRLPEKKKGIWGLGEALQAISDFEYSMGCGVRYELEQNLKDLLKENNQ